MSAPFSELQKCTTLNFNKRGRNVENEFEIQTIVFAVPRRWRQ